MERDYRSIVTKIALNCSNCLIIQELSYLEGVVAHGRASSNLAFGTIFNRALNRSNTAVQGFFVFMAQVSLVRIFHKRPAARPENT